MYSNLIIFKNVEIFMYIHKTNANKIIQQKQIKVNKI